MKGNDFIPKAESKFYLWESTFINNASTIYKLCGIPENKWTELLSHQEDYHIKYSVANNTTTRTSASVLAKNSSRKEYITLLRKIIKGYITYNMLISDEDRKIVGLPVHKKTRTPAQTPADKANFDIQQTFGSRLAVHFRYRYSGYENNAARPAYIHGIEIAWAILDAPPSSYSDLKHSVLDTRSPYIFQFNIRDAGKRFYCALRWENTRSAKGPWSEIKSAIIP
ncbi:MAG: hypothetical protein LBJ17_03205 [Dysgonamonadaceae bacterium]|jgi:hypothetical protein|nr:hypothetical protein [Dysgonamonadaceae bacterium]